jgi:hypothetical protein
MSARLLLAACLILLQSPSGLLSVGSDILAESSRHDDNNMDLLGKALLKDRLRHVCRLHPQKMGCGHATDCSGHENCANENGMRYVKASNRDQSRLSLRGGLDVYLKEADEYFHGNQVEHDGSPMHGTEESDGLATDKWRFLGGGWRNHNLVVQHVESKTTLAMYAWASDATFRFKKVDVSNAMYCWSDASIIECLWFPDKEYTGVTVRHTQEDQDWYFVETLLDSLREGHGARMRRHGINFGVYWRFRPLGDYILATHTVESIELWLTPEGFVCLAEEGQNMAVIVKNGEIFDNITRADGEAEIRGIAELRDIVAMDEEGFEADFITHRNFIMKRGRQKDMEMGWDPADDESLTSDPDFDNIDKEEDDAPQRQQQQQEQQQQVQQDEMQPENMSKEKLIEDLDQFYNLTESDKIFIREYEPTQGPWDKSLHEEYKADYRQRYLRPKKHVPIAEMVISMDEGAHARIRDRLGLPSLEEYEEHDRLVASGGEPPPALMPEPRQDDHDHDDPHAAQEPREGVYQPEPQLESSTGSAW